MVSVELIPPSAIEAAELEIVSHPLVTIPAADWVRFEAWANSPAKEVKGLRELAAHRPVWQD